MFLASLLIVVVCGDQALEVMQTVVTGEGLSPVVLGRLAFFGGSVVVAAWVGYRHLRTLVASREWFPPVTQ